MNESSNSITTRREFIKTTGRIAAASALAGVAIPHVHAAGSSLIQVGLVGCGGRGTGAAGNALSSSGGPMKLVAMRSEEHTSELQSQSNLVCRLLLEKKTYQLLNTSKS